MRCISIPTRLLQCRRYSQAATGAITFSHRPRSGVTTYVLEHSDEAAGLSILRRSARLQM